MSVLYSYVFNINLLLLIIILMGAASIILLEVEASLSILGISVFLIICLGFSDNFKDHNKIKDICDSLKLDMSQCVVKAKTNEDENFEVSIILSKPEICSNFINLINNKDQINLINNKEQKCTKTQSIVFYDYKPINFIVKSKTEDVLIAFDSKKDKVQLIKDEFFKEENNE